MAQSNNSNDLLKMISGIASGAGKNAVANHSLGSFNEANFKRDLAGALGIPLKSINFNTSTGIVEIKDGSKKYQIDLVGQVKGSPTYANYKGKTAINRSVVARDENNKLGLTDLTNATRRAAVDILKNDHRIKDVTTLAEKIHYINQEITSLQKDYLKIEDAWDVQTSKAERRSRPSGNIVTDTERASTVNYLHQLEKDLSNIGAYWKKLVVPHKKSNESWNDFNVRVEDIATNIVGEILNGTDKKLVVKNYPEFKGLINQLYKDYGFLGGTAAAANRKRSVLLPVNETGHHNIGTEKEHKTHNVATQWHSNKVGQSLFKNILGIATKNEAKIAKANNIKLSPANVYLAKVVKDQDIKDGGVLNSIRDSHMMIAKQAADEMRYIARDYKKLISVNDILNKNKRFKGWNDPNAMRKAVAKVLQSDKDFVKEMQSMSEEEMDIFYKNMEINAQGFNDKAVAYEIKSAYKKDHFNEGSGKMVVVGGTGRNSSLVANKDNFGMIDGIPVTMLVGEYLEGAKYTSDIMMDQLHKLVLYGESNGAKLSEQPAQDLANILNEQIKHNSKFKVLREMGFNFEIQDGLLVYNLSTGDIEKGAEKLYNKELKKKTGKDATTFSKDRAKHIEENKDLIFKNYYELLGHFNKNLQVVSKGNKWDIKDLKKGIQFLPYAPADVAAPLKGNTSSGGFEGQRNTVENAKKFGKEFKAGIQSQYMNVGEELKRRRESWDNTRQIIRTNQKLIAGTHGTKIELADILPEDFDPNKKVDLNTKPYVGDKVLASVFDQTTMGMILSKVASGNLDLSKGGFINVPWIDEQGNERIGIPIEPISKAEAEKLRKSFMTDTEGNQIAVYNSGDIDQRFALFNDAFSLKNLYAASLNNATPDDRGKIGDKVLEYGKARSNSLFDNAGSEAVKYGKADTFNSMRGVAHATNPFSDNYTSNTIWLSDDALKSMLSRRDEKDKNASHGLTDKEAQAILSTWNASHANNQLDYNAWQAGRGEKQRKDIQQFLYEKIKGDTKGELADLLVAGVNRDPTIGVDATKWARVRYSDQLAGKDIGVSDDLAWLVSMDFDGDQVRAALLTMGIDSSDANDIAKRYEQARVAQQSDNQWGSAVDRWLNYIENEKPKSDEELQKELETIYTSEDAHFSNNPVLKNLNADYTTYAKTRIGNFGNNQFNALKLFSSEGTNLINTNPAEAELFLAMMEQFYQEAISGKKLLERAKDADDPAKVFAEGRTNIDALTQLISSADTYTTEEGRKHLIETFQKLMGINTEDEKFFVNKKLKTQVVKRLGKTKEGRLALYKSLDKSQRDSFNKIDFLADNFNIDQLSGKQFDALYESSFFDKTNTAKAFETVVRNTESQGRLNDLVYNRELETNARAQAEHENMGPLFQSLEGSNQKLIDALNRLTNVLEGKAGGGAGGGGGNRQLTPYEAAQQLKLGEGAYPLSISRVTGAINPYGGQDDTAFLHNLLNNGSQKRFGYGSIKKLKQAAGGRPFASRLGNASGSMAELMALLGTDTWRQTLKRAGKGGKNLSGDALEYYNDVFRNREELQKVADAYYGKSGINQKNYSFDKYFRENVIKTAESQKKQLLNYFGQTGFEITGSALPEAMVAGVLNGKTVTSRTDIGFKGRYTKKVGDNLEEREGLLFADLKNKEGGSLSLNDTMQAAFTNYAMRTVLSVLKNERTEEAEGLVKTYNDQMKKLGFNTNFTLSDLEKQFKNSDNEWIDEQDLMNIVIKGTGKNSRIYKLTDNKSAIDLAVEYMGKVLAGGDLTDEEKRHILSLMSLSTDTGSISGGAGGGAGSGGSGGKGRKGTGTSARASKFAEYKTYAAKYAKYVRDIAQMEGSMDRMSPDQRAMYQEYLQDLYTRRDAAQSKLKPLYDSLSKEDVKLAEEYNAQLDNTIKKVYAQQGANGQAQKKSLFGQLADGIKTSMQRMFSFGMVGYRIVGKISQAFQKVVGYAQQLDQAMVNIQIVTGKTREEAFNLMDTYNKLAKQLGSTTTEIANSANVWFNESRDHIKPL